MIAPATIAPATHPTRTASVTSDLPLNSDLPVALAWPLLSFFCRQVSPPAPPRRRKALVASNNERDDFTERLLAEVMGLSVTGYESLIARLLQTVGYDHVQVLRAPSRNRKSHKGRNRHGGVDIVASSRTGLSTGRVLVQVKQYERPVSRRFVDELRGALLRREARHALLITTSRFSPAARDAAREDHVAPVHLLDGEALVRLLMHHGIGAQRNHQGVWQIDQGFFHSLNDANSSEKTPRG